MNRSALQRQFAVILVEQHGTMDLLTQEGALVGEVIFAMEGVAQLQFGATLGDGPTHSEELAPSVA
jgi:hypothetical protein